MARLWLAAALSMAAGARGLDALQWRYRLIVVFAPDADRAGIARTPLTQSDGVDARDIAWFVTAPRTMRSNIKHTADTRSWAALHDSQGFEVVLVGKDGSIKARQQDALDPQALFELIGQMPMRQQETRQHS